MNNYVDLTDSVNVKLVFEKKQALLKYLTCYTSAGELFDFSIYSGATLSVKASPSSDNLFEISTVGSEVGKLDLLPDGVIRIQLPVSLSVGEYFFRLTLDYFTTSFDESFDFSLSDSSRTRSFLRGNVYVVDESNDDIDEGSIATSVIVRAPIAFTGETSLSNYITGATSLGNHSIVGTKSGKNLRFKGLVAGSNITLTPSSTGITISSSGSGGGSGTITGATNGLSVTGVKLKLGGVLTGDTTLTLGTNSLSLTGSTGKLLVGVTSTPYTATHKLQVLSNQAGGNQGLLLRNSSNNAAAYTALDLYNDAAVQSQIFLTSSSYTPTSIRSSGFGFYNGGAGGITIAAGGSGEISLVTAGLATTDIKMHIASAGAVGVGTTTPTQLNGNSPGTIKFNVFSTSNTAIAVDGTNNYVSLFLNDRSQAANSRLWSIANTNTTLAFQSLTDTGTATSRLTIDRVGNITTQLTMFARNYSTPNNNALIFFDMPLSDGIGIRFRGLGGANYTNVSHTGIQIMDSTLANTGTIGACSLAIIPVYNFTAAHTGGTITGIDYNPTLTSMVGVSTHIAFRAVTGNVLIGSTTGTTSAILELKSTSKAFLPPKGTTTQKNAITPVTSGMLFFDITLNKLCVYGASSWETITSA